MNLLILRPVLAEIGLIAALYAWLGLARIRAVGRGAVAYDAFVLGRREPRPIARITRNLANPFEMPVLLVGCVGLLMASSAVRTVDLALAWLFVAGRLAQTAVQTLTDDVLLRSRVFTVNFLAFLGIAGHLAPIASGLPRGAPGLL